LTLAIGFAAGATGCGSGAATSSNDAAVDDVAFAGDDVASVGITFGDDGSGNCLAFCPTSGIVISLSCPTLVTSVGPRVLV
jgi:hypothetical protein